MTSTTRRTALLAPLAAAVLALAAAPGAAADTDPGSGGGECSNVMSTSVPESGKLKFTWTMSCTRNWSKIEHGVTIQRWSTSLDKWVVVTSGYRTCLSTSGTLRTCRGSFTVSDPAGTQHWKSLDETARYAYAGSGAVRADYIAGTYH